MLPHIISDHQNAFVPNRLITDNIIVTFETIHAIKRRGKNGRKKMIVKLDMARAHDRVEWGFLVCMMEKLGFCNRWSSLTSDCISTVTYSELCNGEVKGFLSPSRGLRQGDPLSPCLFLICAEGLSALLRKAELNGDIHGISVADEASSINHLLYADDSLIFGDASIDECKRLKEVLSTNEAASGQK